MRHRGEHVGNLYVAEMEGGREFTSEDEDTQVIFWGAVLVDRETGERVGKDDMEAVSRELKRIPFARTYTVFNRQQCEDVGESKDEAVLAAVETMPEPQDVMDAYLEAEGLRMDHTRFHGAFYKPQEDRIVLPDPGRFDDPARYYITAFHELAHSAGHTDRLARGMDTHFGTHSYGVEELTAERSAALLGGQTGLNFEPDLVENSAAYLKSWLKIIREDPSIVWVAAQRAQKAVDFIMSVPERLAERAPVEDVEVVMPAPQPAFVPISQPALIPAFGLRRAVH